MINKLTDISDISVIDQNINHNLFSFTEISYEDKYIDEGGFGSIHTVFTIGGKPTKEKYLLKILFQEKEQQEHAYNVINILHKKIKRYQTTITHIPIYHSHPELLGLPFAVFKAKEENTDKELVAFLMYDLNNLGYVDFGKDEINSDELDNLETIDRLYIAYEFSKAIDFFHLNNFIHSDLKEASIFINPKTKQLAIIDYDGGYNFDKQDKPSTLGAIGHWLSSKWRQLIKTKETSELTYLDRLTEEEWWLANAIFQLIFYVPPFFFLKDVENQTEYLKNNKWPNTAHTKELYIENNLPFIEKIRESLRELSDMGLDSLTNAFITVFNDGFFKENKRLSAKEWKKLLSDIIQEIEPQIIKYDSDKTIITRKNEEVTFNWEVAFFNLIYLNGDLVNIGQYNKVIQIEDAKSVKLLVKNDFNEIFKTIEILAEKKEPIIKNINLSKTIRENINDKIELEWETENVSYVTISTIKDRLEESGKIELLPTKKTKYIFTAFGYFDEKVTKEFDIDVVSPEILVFKYKINIEKGIKNIDVFWETKNSNYVEITPIIGKQKGNGNISIDIEGKTSLKLIAYGDFSSVERVIEAQPFPIPVIKELMFEYPKLEKSFRTKNILNWQEINKNRLNLIHPELQVNTPNINIDITKDLPEFELKLSIDLEQQIQNNIIIDNISFVDLDKDLKNKLNNYE